MTKREKKENFVNNETWGFAKKIFWFLDACTIKKRKNVKIKKCESTIERTLNSYVVEF